MLLENRLLLVLPEALLRLLLFERTPSNRLKVYHLEQAENDRFIISMLSH